MSFFSSPSKRRESLKSASGKRTFVPRLEALESRDLLSIFTVINTSSDPNTSGSLPWAVQQSNSTPGPNTIDFNIPGSGVRIININSILSLTGPVLINGTSQPGYNGTPLISVQGNANVQYLFDMPAYGSSGSTIEGLDMYDYTMDAVNIQWSTPGNIIQNDWIGFFRDPTTGQVSLNYNLGGNYNDSTGILVQGSGNNIRNNVIDGNSDGIVLQSVVSHYYSKWFGNSITSNFIGTDPSGNTAAGYGNRGDGIDLNDSQSTWITSNVLSGNAANGIGMNGPDTTGNVISGNIIGLNANQTAVISPGNYGISISNGSTGNQIQGNVIAGAKYYGVELLSGSSYNSVLQNFFGPNGVGSVYVEPNTNWNSIGYTPQPTLSSLTAQLQIILDYYSLMVQAVETSNPSGFFDALQGCVYFAVIVEAEILNSSVGT